MRSVFDNHTLARSKGLIGMYDMNMQYLLFNISIIMKNQQRRIEDIVLDEMAMNYYTTDTHKINQMKETEKRNEL